MTQNGTEPDNDVAKPNSPDRDERGLFVPGNSGGPGRPKAPPPLPEERLAVLARTVTKRDWIAIINEQVRRAKKGQPASVKWLSKYLLPDQPLIDITMNMHGFDQPMPTLDQIHSALFEVLGIAPPAAIETTICNNQDIEYSADEPQPDLRQ